MIINTTQNKTMTKNSNVVVFIFIVTVIFQITAYKFIWEIEWVSRYLNIAVLIIAGVYALIYLTSSYNYKVYYYYLIPGLMVYAGIFFNIFINSVINLNVINQFGLLISWTVYLAIPGFIKFRKLDVTVLWRYFHYFMLMTVSFSILEYFALLNGFVAPRPIVTSGGPFMAGNFSMLHALETGDLYYRFYASFMEPGTLAMFLLPAMAYAFLYRKYLSLIIYSFAMISSDSLGGFIGVATLIPLLTYFRFRKYAITTSLIIIITTILISIFYVDDFIERYDQKNQSATVREESTLRLIKNLPDLFINYPFGLPLTESTENAQENTSYFGSNFTPGTAFNLGGIISFLGYVAIIFVSLFYAVVLLLRKNLSHEEQTVVASIICLFPFIFQRTVVWDSSIFGLLYAPFVIRFLQDSTSNFRFQYIRDFKK
jgi:hypothetical protein